MDIIEQIVRAYISKRLTQGTFEFGKVMKKPIEKSTKDVALEITKLAHNFEKPKIKWLEICKFTNDKGKDKYIIIQG